MCLKREQIRLALQDHSRSAREIVALTMDPNYEPVGLPADMPRAGLPSIESMEKVIYLQRATKKTVKPNKENDAAAQPGRSTD